MTQYKKTICLKAFSHLQQTVLTFVNIMEKITFFSGYSLSCCTPLALYHLNFTPLLV